MRAARKPSGWCSSAADWSIPANSASISTGQLRVHIQTTLPLAEAAKAHEFLESGRTTGKIVLTV